MANPTKPSAIWGGAVSSPGEDSQIGCVFCAAENVSAPVLIVYMYQGTSYCRRHLNERVFGVVGDTNA